MTARQQAFAILLAEDNLPDVVLVRTALEEAHLDCTLHVMEDGAQAIAFIEEMRNHPEQPRLDLVLLDMHLPKYDGVEILKRLRAVQRLAQTPVIVMTSSDSPRDHHDAQEFAAVHYFRKPSDLTEFMRLGEVVRNILHAGTSCQGAS
jgi:CheY-like chemotaxis protein